MLGKIPAARLALIEKIVRSAPRRLPAGSRALARDFLRAFFRGVAEEDLRAHHPANLARAALAHLDLGRERPGNRVLVELAEPLDTEAPTSAHRAIVRLVAPDMPFLVESVGIVFSEMNIAVHLIVHPVLNVRRDTRGRIKAVVDKGSDARPESWQLMEIDRPRDDAQAKELLQSEGRVAGARVHIQGREVRVVARRGVVLACGGYPHDMARITLRYPHLARGGEHVSPVPPENTCVATDTSGAAIKAAASSATSFSQGSERTAPRGADRAMEDTGAVYRRVSAWPCPRSGPAYDSRHDRRARPRL